MVYISHHVSSGSPDTATITVPGPTLDTLAHYAIMSQTAGSWPAASPWPKPLRPPYDPLLQPGMDSMNDMFPEVLDLARLRQMDDVFGIDHVLKAQPDFDHEDISVPGLEPGDADVTLTVFTRKGSTRTDRPCFYFVHGGGQVGGRRFTGLDVAMGYFAPEAEAVFVAVEYRRAPEHRAPAALHDTYAGLLWTAENAVRLGIDAAKIIVSGVSGGGPLAMGTAMLCRNNRKEFPFALMLQTPMLDDRDCTSSSKQFARDGPWCGTTNRMAWDHVLGADRGTDAVSELVAPARATDLRGLPQTFIDAAACEVFRDEAVAVASTLWRCGVNAELHVWPGAYHGFDMLSQDAPVAVFAAETKRAWLKRVLEAREKELGGAAVQTIGQKPLRAQSMDR